MGNKLYVGNLPYTVRDEDLQQSFGQFGAVTSAKVMMERDTGRSKGFGSPRADAAPRAVPPAPGLGTINARAWVNPDATPPLATFETVIVNEWIPHIDATYRTISVRVGRAIEGQSMGGFGAAHLGFTLRRALPAEARPGTKPIRTVTAHTC